MNKRREEIIERLCALSYRVMEERFRFQRAADCFCHRREEKEAMIGPKEKEMLDTMYTFDESVIQFIERAVQRALEEKE